MKKVSIRTAVAAFAISGFAVGTALFGAGSAAADPAADIAPLVNSTCSYAQVDRAIHQVAPDAAAVLDADAGQKEMLRRAYSQPAAQRKVAFQRLIGQQGANQGNPAVAAKLRQVADACHRF